MTERCLISRSFSLFKYLFLLTLFFFFFFLLGRVLVAAHGIFDLRCSMQTLSCGMWDLVPRPGIKPGPPALGMWSLSHWTIREVPQGVFKWQGLWSQVSEQSGCGENVICLNSRTAASFPQLRPLFRSTLKSSCE